MGNEEKTQLTSSEPEVKKVSFPWDITVLSFPWLIFSYYSVAFPHKTFHIDFLEIPMTPLLLFFAACLIVFIFFIVTDKNKDIGIDILASLVLNILVFFPVPITWFLLYFYEVNTIPSFLAILIVPIIFLLFEFHDWIRSRKTGITSIRRIRGMAKPIKLIGIYMSGLVFGYGTIIFMSYAYCYFTNQSFEMFARANPAIILLGGTALMGAILAFSRPSR
jgi:hypothetical protein